MKLILLLLLISTSAVADIDGLFSVGMGKDVLSHQNFERVGTLGVRYGKDWKVQANTGYYFAPAEGQVSSYFGSLQGGLEVVGHSGIYSQAMFGPALVSASRDSKLTGHFQFHLATGVGIKSDNGYSLALIWSHLSNAGIELPNIGRDLLTLQVIIPIVKTTPDCKDDPNVK